MASIPGALPSRPSELARVEDRASFVYFEHAVISRDANALTATGENGVFHLPSAGLLVLMLGPGTSVTHQAMVVLADSGAAIVWVGEEGVRYYAGGRPLARSTRLLERQAAIVSNTRRRVNVARRMYAMRFPKEDTAGLSMQQLRGREGARVRAVYRDWAKQTGVKWDKRDYNAEDFDAGDSINQALSAANSCLYGVVHAATVALGCSAGLGIVHTGHDRSFIYDIADLYKAEISIPVAFQAVAALASGEVAGEMKEADISSAVRRSMRDRFAQTRLIERIVSDIKTLLSDSVQEAGDIDAEDKLQRTPGGEGENLLWDAEGVIPGGQNHEENGPPA